MELRFNEVKATQLAARLLHLRGTGRMKYLEAAKAYVSHRSRGFIQMGTSGQHRPACLNGQGASF